MLAHMNLEQADLSKPVETASVSRPGIVVHQRIVRWDGCPQYDCVFSLHVPTQFIIKGFVLMMDSSPFGVAEVLACVASIDT